MDFYIGIEDLVSNALIEMLNKDDTKRFISYRKLEEYGARVIQILENKGKKAILILSRNNTDALFRNYSEFFLEKEEDGYRGIYLKDNKSVDDLIEKFTGYLSTDILLALADKDSVQVLGVA